MFILEKRIAEMRAQSFGALLLFKLADLHEAFGDDAHDVGAVSGLPVTAAGAWPMCIIPAARLDEVLRQLIQAGKRVAICEQVTHAPASTIERIVEEGSLTS